MKEKILLALKAKFPAVNLSKKRLDAIAAKIETKIGTDETLIDAKIDEFNDYSPLVDIAKQDDKIRDLESKVKPPATPPKNDDPPADPPAPDDTPAWAKGLIESNKKLQLDLQALQSKEAKATLKGQIEKALKDVPVSYWNKRGLPEREEDKEAFIAEVQADYKTFEQELVDQGIVKIPPPRTGGGSNNGKPTEKELDGILDNIKI